MPVAGSRLFPVKSMRSLEARVIAESVSVRFYQFFVLLVCVGSFGTITVDGKPF